MLRLHICCLALAACFVNPDESLWGQMVTTQMPLQSNTSSFYEQSQIGWSVHNPHYFMNFHGGGAAPPFGGFQPNAGIQSGFAIGNDHFNFGFAQGASITSTTVAPMLTTTNGFPGLLFVGSERPFVTGVVPTVGAGFASVPPVDPLTSRMAAGEFRIEKRRVVVPGLEAARQVKDAARQPRLAQAAAPSPKPEESASPARELTAAQYFERAAIADKEGRSGVAKIYYQLAATKGDAVIKAQATEKLDALKAVSAAKP